MTNNRDVVITGAGVVSPLGIGKLPFWRSMLAGTSGVGPLQRIDPGPHPVPFGGEVLDFEPKQFVTPRKALKVMCREVQIGFAAARLAVDDARLQPESLKAERFGVVFGCEMLYCDLPEMREAFAACVDDGQFDMAKWGPVGMTRLFPLWLLLYLPNMAACHLAISFNAQGPTNSVTCGDVSGLQAIVEGVRYIERGDADVMLVGGTGTRLNPTQLGFRADTNLSHRSDDPAAACRPFDLHRDGMVNGEGAGAFVLETREHARARGANILARVAGCGVANDPYRDGQVVDRGAIRRAMAAALAEADMKPEDVGHVNAHGVSTLLDDRREAAAIRDLLGDVPVTAPKSFFGNLGAGSGAVEMVASVMALTEGRVPFTRNYEVPDPSCPIHVVQGEPLTGQRPTAMLLSQASLGQSVALLIAADD